MVVITYKPQLLIKWFCGVSWWRSYFFWEEILSHWKYGTLCANLFDGEKKVVVVNIWDLRKKKLIRIIQDIMCDCKRYFLISTYKRHRSIELRLMLKWHDLAYFNWASRVNQLFVYLLIFILLVLFDTSIIFIGIIHTNNSNTSIYSMWMNVNSAILIRAHFEKNLWATGG